MDDGTVMRRATFAELDTTTIYHLLQLRSEVFVVEQRCCYQDPDGRDAEPTTIHLWIERDGEPLALLRILSEDGGAWRIGRVATRARERGTGLASRLIREALALTGRPVALDAQSHLEGWYSSFGFVTKGEIFLEDGIPHVPMELA